MPYWPRNSGAVTALNEEEGRVVLLLHAGAKAARVAGGDGVGGSTIHSCTPYRAWPQALLGRIGPHEYVTAGCKCRPIGELLPTSSKSTRVLVHSKCVTRPEGSVRSALQLRQRAAVGRLSAHE